MIKNSRCIGALERLASGLRYLMRPLVVCALLANGCSGDGEEAPPEHRLPTRGVCLGHLCAPQAICIVSEGAPLCVCVNGYQDHDGDGTCEAACSSDSCPEDMTCNDDTGVLTCECAPGYQDNDEDGRCDEACGSDSCPEHGICDDATGVIHCSCAPGFQDIDNNGRCHTTCEELSCDENSECRYSAGVPRCACKAGFQDRDEDGVCKPACLEGLCGDPRFNTCEDSSGTVECGCRDFYQDNDGDGVCQTQCLPSSCNLNSECDDSSGAAVCGEVPLDKAAKIVRFEVHEQYSYPDPEGRYWYSSLGWGGSHGRVLSAALASDGNVVVAHGIDLTLGLVLAKLSPTGEQLWGKVHFGFTDDSSALAITSDGTIVVAGHAAPNESYPPWLVRFTADGNLEKSFELDYPVRQLVPFPDGDLLLLGRNAERMRPDGTLVWSRELPFDASGGAVLSDGSIVAVGARDRVEAIGLDASGTSRWAHAFPNTQRTTFQSYDLEALAAAGRDGSALIGAWFTEPFDSRRAGQGHLIYVDNNGEPQWHQRMIAIAPDYSGLQPTPDGGFLVGGRWGDRSFIRKLDDEGRELSTRISTLRGGPDSNHIHHTSIAGMLDEEMYVAVTSSDTARFTRGAVPSSIGLLVFPSNQYYFPECAPSFSSALETGPPTEMELSVVEIESASPTTTVHRQVDRGTSQPFEYVKNLVCQQEPG